jgi:hypothetical protein
MKFLIIYLISTLCYAQISPEIVWTKTYPDQGKAFDVKATPDGGYVVCGESYEGENFHGAIDFAVYKIDSDGNKQWSKNLGGSSVDAATSICLSLDGGYVVVGKSLSNNGDIIPRTGLTNNLYNVWLIKLDDYGNILFSKVFGGSFPDGVATIINTTDGGYAFVTASYSYSQKGLPCLQTTRDEHRQTQSKKTSNQDTATHRNPAP